MIAIIRDDGYYTGSAGQVIRTRPGSNVAASTELWVFNDDVPLIEVWRRSHSRYQGEYAFLDRGQVVIAFTRAEEDDIEWASLDSKGCMTLGWGAKELRESGFVRMADLDAIEQGMLTYWSTYRAKASRQWLAHVQRAVERYLADDAGREPLNT
jgi:hypothetical protein